MNFGGFGASLLVVGLMICVAMRGVFRFAGSLGFWGFEVKYVGSVCGMSTNGSVYEGVGVRFT